MKTLPLAIISAAIVLASCSSAKYAATSEYDDVYYNPNRLETQAAVVAPEAAVTPQEAMNAQPMNQEQEYLKSQPVEDENLSDYEKYRLQREAEMLGETYTPEGSEAIYAQQYAEQDTLGAYGQESAPVIVNNYNYYSDPTDYYYSSALRRFSDTYYGWDYYDPYYTDLYWYTGSPFSWGISMGWGYPGWGMRFSYGYPYYRPYYGYYGYYDPFYSWGYGYYPGYWGGYWGGYPYYWGGSYWAGYNHGFYNGYYYGGGDYYGSNYRYGRLDNRHYYGYSRPTSVISGSAKGSTAGDPRYRSRTVSSESARPAVTRTARTVNTNQGQLRSTSSTATQRQVRTSTNAALQRNSNGTVRTTRTPQSATIQQRSNVRTGQTYTPTYSKPRTSTSSTYNRSAVQNRSTIQSGTPQRTTTNRTFTTPSRSSTTYSRPSSSSRSSSTFSRPSSSVSRSYSSPSRSSGSVSRSSGSVSRSSGSVSRSSGSVSRSSGGSVSRSSGGSVSRSSGGSSRSSSSRR